MTHRTDSSRAGRSRSAGARHTAGLVAPRGDERAESVGCRALQVLGSACGIGSGPTCIPRDHRPVATWAPFPASGCNPDGITVRGGCRGVRFPGSPSHEHTGARTPRAGGRETFPVTRDGGFTSTSRWSDPRFGALHLLSLRPASNATATHRRARSEVARGRRGSPMRSGGFSHASGGACPHPHGWDSSSSRSRRSHFFRPAASSRVQGMAARPGSSVDFSHSLIGRQTSRRGFLKEPLQQRGAPHRSRQIGFAVGQHLRGFA